VFGSRECIQISKNPVEYKVRKINSTDDFFKLMKSKGFENETNEQEGAMHFFVNAKGEHMAALLTQVEYYCLWIIE
jgi:hypothetical protein